MSINSRNKGAAFERQIANALIEDLNLTNPVKRILEQTRTKELPDLMLGNWCIECKAYGTGAEPRPCLLYTSPSPRDGLLSRMPSSA